VRRLVAAALLVTCLGLSACSGADQQGTPQQQMVSWVKGTSYGATAQGLGTDAKKATSILAGGSPNEVHTICGVFLLDVEQANGMLPTPDQQSTSLLSHAYESLGAAARSCFDAPGSPAKRAAFATQKGAGLASLTEATARVESVLGEPLSQVGGATMGVTGGATGSSP
jgi:hypothetical protein